MSWLKIAIFQIFFFLIIYAPVWQGIDFLFVIAFLFAIYGLIRYGINNLIAAIKPLLVLVPLFLYFIINAVFLYEDFSGGNIMFLVLKPIRILGTAAGCYVLVRLLYVYCNGYFQETCLAFILCSVFIHALIMIFESINSDFRIMIQSTLFAGQDTRGTYNEAYRMGGLMGITGGAVLSVVQSVGVLVLPYLLFLTKKNTNRYIYIFMGICIMYSILVCGRSGLLGILLFLPISMYQLYKKDSLKLSVAYIILIIVFIISVNLVLSFVYGSGGNDEVRTMYSRNLDTLINYERSGTLRDETIIVLYDMIIFPNKAYVWLLGDCTHLFKEGFDRVLKSDIGYIRNLWSMGLIGMYVYLLPYIKMIKRRRLYNDSLSKLSILLICYTLLFHTKEMFAYCRCLFSIVMIIYFASFIINNKGCQVKN